MQKLLSSCRHYSHLQVLQWGFIRGFVCSCRLYEKFVPPESLALLNAKPENVRREAQTIAQAGLPGAVTIATNMAGRGTDIVLGGNPKGLALQVLMKVFARYFLTGWPHFPLPRPAPDHCCLLSPHPLAGPPTARLQAISSQRIHGCNP